ncbi:hypothetical protein UU5_04124 [Rhodanobacter sp. 115]|nr:hypothetical protein UU5_04124 [Rhodanobacter sp. 115]
MAKKAAVRKTAGKKAVAPKTAGKAVRKVVAKKAASTRKAPPAAPAHITQEEAVAQIQALLEAKRERVQNGPNWPGAEAQAHHPESDVHDELPSHANASGDAPHGIGLAHARGEGMKRGKS